MDRFSQTFSIVIPVMNESESIRPLASEISRIMARDFDCWECIWVNDGSTDDTGEVLEELVNEQPGHVLVDLGEHCGQSAALAAGFSVASGEILATLDGDGQNDPEDLVVLFEYMQNEGLDMVNGIRTERSDSWLRRVCSRLANGFRNRLIRENITDVGCSIRVFRAECVADIPAFKGMHRFLPPLVRMDRAYGWVLDRRTARSAQASYKRQDKIWNQQQALGWYCRYIRGALDAEQTCFSKDRPGSKTGKLTNEFRFMDSTWIGRPDALCRAIYRSVDRK